MSGNVWEWCWDKYGSSERVNRGGSWYYIWLYYESGCALSYRGYDGSPGNRFSYLGFRVVRNAN